MAAQAAALWQYMCTVAAEHLRWDSIDLQMLLYPVAAYWLVSGFYELLNYLQLPALEKYRIHTAGEERSRNRLGKLHVLKQVLLQHLIQTTLGISFVFLDPGTCAASRQAGGWRSAVLQFVSAMFVMDTWQYAIHRLAHENKWLYKHVHSRHHRLVIPYAYGALYNHLLEAFFLDSLGGLVTLVATGMSCHVAACFFTFATVKTVLDHCGYVFPVNPFHPCLPNNSVYHDVHHDPRGIKANFSQPFFTIWDHLLGTYMDPQELSGSGADAADKKAE